MFTAITTWQAREIKFNNDDFKVSVRIISCSKRTGSVKVPMLESHQNVFARVYKIVSIIPKAKL
jgi:hypothetical protein